MNRTQKIVIAILNAVPWMLFVGLCLALGTLSDRFLERQNLINIAAQASSLAIIASGMTLVLVTAGVDLSIGSLMFLAVAVAGKVMLQTESFFLACVVGSLVGLAAGLINGTVIVRLKIVPFIATLATLFMIRGIGLWFTNTRAMNMPDAVTALGATKWLGIPLPVIAMLIVLVAIQWMLSKTPTGRHLFAIGHDIKAAKKAGLPVDRCMIMVYTLCGLCAAIGGLVALTQTGAVSPSFGSQREFAAIAAAVLGGTSLFGGRGNVLPGTLFGAILFQTVENGLVIINADPYLYPIIVSSVIFLAVLLDTTKSRLVNQLSRRKIRVEPVDKPKE